MKAEVYKLAGEIANAMALAEKARVEGNELAAMKKFQDMATNSKMLVTIAMNRMALITTDLHDKLHGTCDENVCSGVVRVDHGTSYPCAANPCTHDVTPGLFSEYKAVS